MDGAGRVVILTGATAGFGRATVLELARRGWRVFAGVRQLGGRNAQAATDLEREARAAGGDLTTIELDVDSDESVAACVKTVLTRAGRIDALVNNAGFGVVGPWESANVEDVRRQFDTNVLGVFRLSQAVVPTMRAQGSGTILNVSSHNAVRPIFLEGIYGASKWAVEGMSMVMRWELQQFGIRVCVVNPGPYVTNYLQSAALTPDMREPSGPYQAMLETLAVTRPKKTPASRSLGEVATRIADLLDLDDPPFRNGVGTTKIRMQ